MSSSSENTRENIAFITGITGQDGRYLTELLLQKQYVVYGLIRRSSNLNTQRIEHLIQQAGNQLRLRYGDVTDGCCLVNILNEIASTHPSCKVVEIYNLAAMSHVKISFEMPEYTAQVDGLGTLKLLEAIRTSSIKDKIRFYQASTSELYGRVLETPQTETTPFNPVSPYAAAKIYAYYITKCYRESYDMFACTGILFNHESPVRGFNFVTRKITIALGKLLKDPEYVLTLGNIDSLRDWGHARDYVYGMWLMLQQDTPDDFVLATGEQYSVRAFVEKAFALKGFKIVWKGQNTDEVGYDEITGRELVRIDPKYYRPNEVETLLGNAKKAHTVLGWKPQISFDQLVQEMVTYDCQ